MRYLWLALFLLCLGIAPARAQSVGPAPLYCNSSFQISQAAVALTRIVTNVPNKQISICGWALNTGAAAATAQLESGSGTNCGIGTTALTPAISLGVNGSYIDHTPGASRSLNQSTDLCIVTTGTGPIQVTVYYGVN